MFETWTISLISVKMTVLAILDSDCVHLINCKIKVMHFSPIFNTVEIPNLMGMGHVHKILGKTLYSHYNTHIGCLICLHNEEFPITQSKKETQTASDIHNFGKT